MLHAVCKMGRITTHFNKGLLLRPVYFNSFKSKPNLVKLSYIACIIPLRVYKAFESYFLVVKNAKK